MHGRPKVPGVSVREKVLDTLGAGIVLWVIGYAAAMVLFLFVPATAIGLIVLPIMIPVTVYFSYTRLRAGAKSVPYLVLVGATWALIAVALDYALLVNAFNVQDYYDLDVSMYYALTFLVPVLVGLEYKRRAQNA
jgi:hypothetical protein